MSSFPEFDSAAFRRAMSKFATGVAHKNPRYEGAAQGIVVNSFASVSLDPALVLWSIDKGSRRRAVFEHADRQAIHILSKAQHAQCMALVKDATAFEGLDMIDRPDGPPLIEGCLARFECEPYASVDAGDHVTLIQKVITASHQDAEPLVFFDRGFGHISKGSQ
ncbi:MAG: flavin reductase family protein [Pseudomonadota bacterium]